MEWNDDAIVLSARDHGENSTIVTVLSRGHGRYAGLVRGGARRVLGVVQPGNTVRARWRARLAEHLGTLTCELTNAVAARLIDDPERLAGLSSACAVAATALPERAPHQRVFDGLAALLGALEAGGEWRSAYVKWEIGLLAELGFGLELGHCAATGRHDDLVYVSPRTGHAVSRAAGEPYRQRLLTLPAFLLNEGGFGDAAEIELGLALTGYFLETHVYHIQNRGLPAARLRLADRIRTGSAAIGNGKARC